MILKSACLYLTYLILTFVGIMMFAACQTSDTDPAPEDTLYFPPTTGGAWETTAPEALGWNTEYLEVLYDFLSSNDTRAFIVLIDGRIVIEKYWGNGILNQEPFVESSLWYWASAGKTITALLTGIAQEEGLLSIEDKTSDYLGAGWTSMDPEKESLITIRHQLTMTTGLEYQVLDPYCTLPICLRYRADAGTQWYYHNAPYTLLESVVANAAGMTFDRFTDEKLEFYTGMNGFWLKSGYNNVYWSTARDAARFGLLLLNGGTWDNKTVLNDAAYFQAMTTPSQELNPSYGYLTWLNGQKSVILPGLAVPLPTSIAPDAPPDLYVASGKNGQFVDVVPSRSLVVVRMGEAPDDALVPIPFHNQMWQQIMQIIGDQDN